MKITCKIVALFTENYPSLRLDQLLDLYKFLHERDSMKGNKVVTNKSLFNFRPILRKRTCLTWWLSTRPSRARNASDKLSERTTPNPERNTRSSNSKSKFFSVEITFLKKVPRFSNSLNKNHKNTGVQILKRKIIISFFRLKLHLRKLFGELKI